MVYDSSLEVLTNPATVGHTTHEHTLTTAITFLLLLGLASVAKVQAALSSATQRRKLSAPSTRLTHATCQ